MKPPAYRQYLLCILLIILAVNTADRLSLGLVLQAIKLDLTLSDSQLGFLSGMGFALFYSIMGIPIGRWADRGNRATIIVTSTLLWCLSLALSGLSTTFTHLLLSRIGVAIGEAACIPAAHSLIADYFTRAERPRAVSRYMLGASLGVIVGYLATGWLNEYYGWRISFVILSLPGIAVALIAYLTIKEPRRLLVPSSVHLRMEADVAGTASIQSVGEVAIWFWRNRTFRQLLITTSIVGFFGYGILHWQAAFFVRSFGFKTGPLGTWFALISGFGSLVGMYCGGEWASRWAANNESLQLRAVAVAYAILGVMYFSMYTASNRYVALGLMGVSSAVGSALLGPLFATIQTLVPARMRATSVALIYLFSNLLGMGLGPLATGVLSDVYQSWAGTQSLRYALLSLCPGYLWGAYHLLRASTTVGADLATTRAVA